MLNRAKLAASTYTLMKNFLTAVVMLCAGCTGYSQVQYNGNFETLNADKSAATGWVVSFQPEQLKAYPVKADSVVKQEGKYALSIEKVNDGSDFGVIDFPILKVFKGDKVQLKGYIKTQNVTGYAGLWMRIDGTTAFDNMQDRGIKGTTDWTEYTIDLPYDEEKATNIHSGALLVGDGKIWVDNFRLYINDKPIEQATVKIKALTKSEKDTAFIAGSKIDTITMSKQQVVNLTVLGQVWGFLKYHHPAIAKGEYNWDAELFRVMPAVLKATNKQQLSAALETWVDKLGVPPLCKNCTIKAKAANVKLRPDYGMLFTTKVLTGRLTAKLTYIGDNRNTGENYYIAMAGNGIGNPSFEHEAAYETFTYPDAGYRMLCLYRYWNMINYFFPYKYLIGENWNDVLADCIPKFAGAANATEYSLNTLALIARIHDTHANIWGSNKALSDYKGRFAVPFQARFVEGKLVVTGYYADTLEVKQLVKPGDVIQSINGQPVPDLIRKFLPYTPASNYETQLRDLPRAFLLRSGQESFKLDVERDGKVSSVTVGALPIGKINYGIDYDPKPKTPGYYLVNDGQLGYLFPGRYKNTDLPEIEKLFAKTKGIIIDMRCYPSDFMPFTFVPYIKSGNAPFVKFSRGDVANPGLFVADETVTAPARSAYQGKVVVIVNAQSQSQAEYTTMAFQSSPNVTVIGSITAAADGNVSAIKLPGNISTMISGLGVYYPDGTETQRKGVKINKVVKPTIKGIKEGRDELLESAKEILLK